METEDMIRELRQLSEVHKTDKVSTFGVNWSLLCNDVADRLTELSEATGKTEQEDNGWIKCSDNLPTDVLDMQDFKQIKVLVRTKNNLVKTCLYRWKKDCSGNYVDWEFSVSSVVAWQPLPKISKNLVLVK